MEIDKLNMRYSQEDSPPKFLGEESSAKKYELQDLLESVKGETLTRMLTKLRIIKNVDELTTRCRNDLRNGNVKEVDCGDYIL